MKSNYIRTGRSATIEDWKISEGCDGLHNSSQALHKSRNIGEGISCQNLSRSGGVCRNRVFTEDGVKWKRRGESQFITNSCCHRYATDKKTSPGYGLIRWIEIILIVNVAMRLSSQKSSSAA